MSPKIVVGDILGEVVLIFEGGKVSRLGKGIYFSLKRLRRVEMELYARQSMARLVYSELYMVCYAVHVNEACHVLTRIFFLFDHM